MEITFETLASQLNKKYEVQAGQMFGKKCLKSGGKAFAALFGEEMVFKTGRESNNKLLSKYKGAQLWDPSGKGRPMKDWLQVPAQYNTDYPALAERAMGFTLRT